MFSHQGVAPFERIRRIRRCNVVFLVGMMSLGVDCLVLNVLTKLSLSFSWPKEQDVAPALCMKMRVPVLSTVMITVGNFQIKCSLLWVALFMVSLPSNRTVIRQ